MSTDKSILTEMSKDETIKHLLDTLNTYLKEDHKLRKGFLREKRIKTITYSLFFGLPLVVYFLFYMDIVRTQTVKGDYVAMVKVQGAIAADAYASADNLVPAIERACNDDKAKGLVLHINSPGGSPVQSDQIYSAIEKCRIKGGKKVVAVGQDTVASGAYWIASAADEIYVNASTITGSIGVKTEGFGVDLTRFASNYGIERRVITAGENKARGDTFQALDEQDIAKSKAILTELHENFIAAIDATRKDRLSGDRAVLFSGDYWTGKTAVSYGLVDGLADFPAVLENVYGVENAVDYSPKASIFDNLRKATGASTLWEGLKTLVDNSSTPIYQAM